MHHAQLGVHAFEATVLLLQFLHLLEHRPTDRVHKELLGAWTAEEGKEHVVVRAFGMPRDEPGVHSYLVPPQLAGANPALSTLGVDLQIGWSVPLGNFGFAKGDGKAFVNTAMTRLQKYEVQTLPNSPFQDFTNTNTIANAATTSGSFPRVKALTSVGVDVGGAVVALRWRYTGAMDDVSRVTTPTNQAVGTKAYCLFDLTGTYSFGERWQLRAGVLNVADKGPVLVASSQTSTDPAVFDVVGRQYYLGMKYTY